METTEFYNISVEYIAQNNIVNITEEEIPDLFGESFLFPNYYLPAFGIDSDYTIIITDYELYLLNKGINIVEPAPKTEYEKKLADDYYSDIKTLGCGLCSGPLECLQEGEWEYELDQELSKKLLKTVGKNFEMDKNKTNQINLVVDEQLYNQIKKNADGAHLRVGKYTKHLVFEAQKNNFIKKFKQCLIELETI